MYLDMYIAVAYIVNTIKLFLGSHKQHLHNANRELMTCLSKDPTKEIDKIMVFL